MATTTNFGWETPDDTDLVKDGALAMRTLGNAIDASLVDLKGGTTGQVLSKTSNTDMDFTWVTSDDANAIQNAIVDAKGDLITATAADTPARLAVGSNGDTLVADSAASTGLRYNPPVGSLANPVINGGFDIWQRGTSFLSPANGYTADRWLGSAATAGTVSRQTVSDSTNLPNIQYAARYQRTNGSTSTTDLNLVQNWETVNSIPFAGKTVTLSFYARAGANFSAASSILTARLVSGTGTDQNWYLSGFTNQTSPINQSATLTTTWQRFAYTGTVATNVTQLGLGFLATPTGTAGANDWYEITGVQLDVGTWTASTAPTFRRAGGTIQGELAACQRYLPVHYVGNTTIGILGQATGTGTAYYTAPFSVQPRVAPTGITITAGTLKAGTSTFGDGGGTGVFNSAQISQGQIIVTGASGLTAGHATYIYPNASATILWTGCEL